MLGHAAGGRRDLPAMVQLGPLEPVRAATGKYLRWDANGDGGHVIRQEGEQSCWPRWMVRDAFGGSGPRRLKTATSGSTWTARSKPAVDLPFKSYFSGDTAPFAYPTLSYDLSKLGCSGQNLYFPIPYQKSCRSWRTRAGAIIPLSIHDVSASTQLPTFSAALAAENAAVLARVDRFFQEGMGTDPAGARPDEEVIRDTASVAAGRSEQLELTGPRAITAIRGRLKFASREDEMAALRSVLLRITFDGASRPQVWCPLGDFFGSAPGFNPYKVLARGDGRSVGVCLLVHAVSPSKRSWNW